MKKKKKISLVELESDKRAIIKNGRSLAVCPTKYLKLMGIGARDTVIISLTKCDSKGLCILITGNDL